MALAGDRPPRYGENRDQEVSPTRVIETGRSLLRDVRGGQAPALQ